MMLKKSFSGLFPFLLCITFLIINQIGLHAQPSFKTGEDPKPAGKIWQLVPELSDEFSGEVLNNDKWRNTDPARWVGRPPGLFKKEAVSLHNDELKFTNYLLPSPEIVNGSTFTHGGAYVRSRNKAKVGMYMECRMKASKTFMSSTFWLINSNDETSGCDRRTTELDIVECVGVVTGNAAWSQDFNNTMHSNTHSRNVSCDTPTGSVGNKTSVGGFVYEDYHTYAAWWKSPTEIAFYLDGEFKYQVTPAADFDLDMHIMLVAETYDWNPVPADGGMNGKESDRTTSYQWVRTWRLANEDGTVDEEDNNEEEDNHNDEGPDVVNCGTLPTTIPISMSMEVSVEYKASQTRDIVFELWGASGWLGNSRVTVEAGSGRATGIINLNRLLPSGFDYSIKASVRPVGADWQESIDACIKSDVNLTEDNDDPNNPNSNYCEEYGSTNGQVVIEAEHLNLGNTAWEEQTVFEDFTGDGYIIWKGSDLFDTPGVGMISTIINIVDPGVYTFQWRSKVGFGNNSTEHNDSWLRFPDADDFYAKKNNSIVYPKGSGKSSVPNGSGKDGWFKVYLSNSLDWTWVTSTSDNDAHAIFVQFNNPGEYTMQISGRSKEHAIDRIVLSKQGTNNSTNLNNVETCISENLITSTQGIALPIINFDIYPNPAEDYITLSLSHVELKNVIIQITNFLGQVQLKQVLPSVVSPLILDISTLGQGIHYLSVKFDESNYITKKMVIQ